MAEYVKGLDELQKQLKAIGTSAGVKALRNATTRATTPVLKEMRAKAPVGTIGHKTYKGRFVAPGFGARSIKKRSKFNKRLGAATVTMGVEAEAFYLIQFYDSRDRTDYTISARRMGRGQVKQVNPYTLRAKPWFSRVFVNNRNRMESTLAKLLKQNIEKAARRGY